MKSAFVAFVAAIVVCATTLAPAQDPVKLSPKFYKVLFENEHVRVLEFTAKPGEKEPMHSHPAMVVYPLTTTKVKFTTPDGKSVESEGKAGTAIWSESVTHTFEILGPHNAHSLLVELKGLQQTSKRPVLMAPNDIKWEHPAGAPPGVMVANLWGDPTKGAYGRFVKFPAGLKLPLHVHTNDSKLIVISGAYVYRAEGGTEKRYGPGSYLFLPGGDRHWSGGIAESETVFFHEGQDKFDQIEVEETKDRK